MYFFYFFVQGCMYSCLARAQERECNCTESKYRTVSRICSETSDGKAMFLFRFTIGPTSRYGEQGCHSGENTRLPTMWPEFDFGPLSCISGSSLLLVLALLRGIFSRFSGFPLSTKTNISKFQFDQDRDPI